MAPIDLNRLRAFAAVHQGGSFSTAAARLGVPRSTVSRAVAALEDALGAQLFRRTTRRVAPTPEGQALFDRVVGPLAGLDAAVAETPREAQVPEGVLKVTTTADLGTAVLAEAAARFTARYPGVRVEARLSTQVVDLVAEGFELALRVAVRPRRDSSLVSRKVGVVRTRLYAAPAYLARRGTPRTAEDLTGHEWVGFRGAPAMAAGLPAAWLGLERPRILCDDMFFAREVARRGGGVALLPTFVAEADLASGALAPVLPRWAADTGEVHLVLPGRRNLPARVTAFREVVLELLRQRPLE